MNRRQAVRDTASRLQTLYRSGGVREVARGIRDYAHYNGLLPLEWVLTTKTLQVDDVAITFTVDGSESVSRARGHGELPVLEDMRETLRDDDVLWDIGANMGSYALLGALVGANVVAFEPGARARSLLVDNAARNGVSDAIDATPYALSDYDGEGVLRPASRPGIRKLADDGVGDTVPVRRGDSVSVPAPDVIKIDVEGVELAVLDGLGDRLSDSRVCYVEVHDEAEEPLVRERLARAGLSVTDSFDEILRAESAGRDE